MGGQAKGAQCRAGLRGRPESLRTRSTASVAGAHGRTDGSFLEMLFSRPSDAALSSPTAPSPLSSLRLFVVASGPTTIFKTVCRSVAPMRASGACTELRMGQLHGWPTGMSNLAGRTSQRWFRPRLGPPAFPVSGTGIATHLAVPAQTRGSSLIPCVQSTTRRGVSAFGHILPPPGPVSGRPRPGASAISHLVSSRRAARQSPCLLSHPRIHFPRTNWDTQVLIRARHSPGASSWI